MNEKPESALRSVPSWLSWVQWISWFRYGNELLLINQWQGMEIDCVPDYEGCIVTNGDEILETVGFSEVKLKWNKRSQQQFQMCLVFFFFQSKFGFDFGMLVVLCFVFRILGFFAILYRSRRKVK